MIDLDHLRNWVGRSETVDDFITPSKVAALAATLDRDDPAPQAGDPLPPPWHWTLCLPAARQSAIGPDGHPARGGFLPPVPLPRRMWAGGRLTFPQPLRVGEAVQRRSQVMSVDHKSGRTGDLVFVLVRHEFHGARACASPKNTTSSIATCRPPMPRRRVTSPRPPTPPGSGRSCPTTCCCSAIPR
jgi:3-methylfumaryl-CoA hydratase